MHCQRRRILAVGALGLALLISCGCGPSKDPTRVLLDEDHLLYAPTELIRTAGGDLVALVAAGEEHRLTLYRSKNEGRDWTRWYGLPISTETYYVELVSEGTLLVVAVNMGRSIWLGMTAADPQSAADSLLRTLELSPEDHAPVTAMTIAAAAPAPDSLPHLFLVYRTPSGAGDASGQRLFRRHSSDGGRSWSGAQQLAEGNLGRPALCANPAGGRTVHLAYTEDRLFRWRGLSTGSRTPVFKPVVQVAENSRNRIAALGPYIVVMGETERQQVILATSENRGRNWERAITIARDANHRRAPDLATGYGFYWSTFNAGDSALVVRIAWNSLNPRGWCPDIRIADVACEGWPSIVALPDTTAGVLFAEPDGRVYFTKVGRPPFQRPPKAPE